MHKTNIYLSNTQVETLRALQKTTDIKLSEHVRRAIDIYLANLKREEKENV